MNTRDLLLCVLLVSIAAFLGSGQTLMAQSISYGKLTGHATDSEGQPLPGVLVELTGSSLISGTKSVTTSETGAYVFLNLPVGRYDISASMEGFQKMIRSGIDVSGGSVVTIDLPMTMGQVAENITISAEGILVDQKTSTFETKLNEELITKIPTARDPFYDLVLTAPGMFTAGKDASWLPSPTAYGSGANENSFLVDGVNATDPRGSAWGSLVNVNYDTVEEVRVIALGSKAEYGSSTGVAVDVLTKSGSNNFHGRGAFYSQLGEPAQ